MQIFRREAFCKKQTGGGHSRAKGGTDGGVQQVAGRQESAAKQVACAYARRGANQRQEYRFTPPNPRAGHGTQPMHVERASEKVA